MNKKDMLILILMLLLLIVFISVFAIVIIRKKIYYRYFDKTKSLTGFDYFVSEDASWLYKEIPYYSLTNEELKSPWLTENRKYVKVLSKVALFGGLAILILGVYCKVTNIL